MNNEKNELEGMEVPVMVTIPEAVRMTNVTQYSIRALIEKGKVKAFRAGKGRYGKWFINLKSLCTYLENPR